MLSGKRLWQVRRTRYSYNILGLVKKGEIEKAEEVFQSMIDRRVYPDVFAYNALIKGYVLNSDARKAFKTFNNLKKRGLFPSDITYTSMFAVCGQTKSAEILDKVMKEVERRGVSLNTLSFNAMLTAMANCGMVDEVFDEVTKLAKPDIDTYRSLLLACARSSMEKLETVWRSMKESGIRPNLQSYNVLLLCLRDSAIPSHMLTVSKQTTLIPNTLKTLRAKREFKLDLGNMTLTLYVVGKIRWLETEDIKEFLASLKKSRIRPDVRMLSLLVGLSSNVFSILEDCQVSLDKPFMKTAIDRLRLLKDEEGVKALIDIAHKHGVLSDLGKAKACLTSKEVGDFLTSIEEEAKDEEMKDEIIRNRLEAVHEVLIQKSIRYKDFDTVHKILKKIKYAEILPSDDIVMQLDSLMENPPPREKVRLTYKFNGMKGYYILWKKAMGLGEE